MRRRFLVASKTIRLCVYMIVMPDKSYDISSALAVLRRELSNLLQILSLYNVRNATELEHDPNHHTNYNHDYD